MKKYSSLLLVILFLQTAAIGQLNSKAAQGKKEKDPALKGNFCLDNTGTYGFIAAYIKETKNKKETAVPPVIDPSCHDCSNNNYVDGNQKKVNAFIDKVGDPEMKMIAELATMEKQWLLLKSADEGKGDLPKCFYDFSEQDFNEKIIALASHVYNDKVIPMYRAYGKNYQYALAGIHCIAYYTRQFLIAASLSDQRVTDDEAMAMIADWEKVYYDHFRDRLTKQYEYQLYPAFMSVIRDLALVTGVDNSTNSELEEYVNRFISFMHFNLKVEFEASGHGDNGAKYHALVKGETELRCRVDREGGCYVWEPVNGNEMEFEVKDVVFQSDEGSATYKGPSTFRTPVQVRVNMCENQPSFRITFDRFGGEEETYISSEGASFHSPLLYTLAMATLGSANLERMKSEANNIKDKANQFKGKESAVDDAAKRLNQHKDDQGYLNSPQGKADMALMRQMAKQMGYGNVQRPDEKQEKNLDNLRAMNAQQQKINAKFPTPGYVGSAEYQSDKAELERLRSGVNMNKLANAAGMDINILMVESPFMMGTVKPVDHVLKDRVKEIAGSANGWEFGQFHVTLENKPDKNDNIRLD
jgi:hypothetical protein